MKNESFSDSNSLFHEQAKESQFTIHKLNLRNRATSSFGLLASLDQFPTCLKSATVRHGTKDLS